MLAERGIRMQDWLRTALDRKGITPVMSPAQNPTSFPCQHLTKRLINGGTCIENYFGKLKENRGIAIAFVQNRPEALPHSFSLSRNAHTQISLNVQQAP